MRDPARRMTVVACGRDSSHHHWNVRGYATPIGMLGQPSIDGRREPVLYNRMMPLIKKEDERA